METNVTTTQSYLTFQLADEIFAASVGYVLEILEVPKITKVPRSPEYMRGVINLRGSVLPVIDTCVKFGIGTITETANTCVIVLQVEIEGQGMMVGALVDAVHEVLEIAPADVQPAPTINSKYKPEFLEGMLKSEDRFILLLNVNKVLSTQEMTILEELKNETAN